MNKIIPDVEKLKDMIRGIPITMSSMVQIYLQEKITEIIDSLAVEVEEGAIEKILSEYTRNMSQNTIKELMPDFVEACMQNAEADRAEFALLQSKIAEQAKRIEELEIGDCAECRHQKILKHQTRFVKAEKEFLTDEEPYTFADEDEEWEEDEHDLKLK